MNTCVFLNLAMAEQRRSDVETSFGASRHTGWGLSRFQALGPSETVTIPGSLSPGEKGCFASHRAALGCHLADEQHLLVAEDDVRFSPQTFSVLDGLLRHAPDWDVIFTDAALCDLSLMVHLARRRDDLVSRGEFNLIDLRHRSWAGATAYCVRDSSKRKLFDALQAVSQLDEPYDLFLRRLADEGGLKIGVCFPFLTTVSAEGDSSQIQADAHASFDQTLNAYRRLMYVDRDLDQCRRDSSRLSRDYCDETSLMVGTVFASIVSPSFPIDR